MKETFTVNLETAQKDEVAAKASFIDLKAAKQDEIDAGKPCNKPVRVGCLY